MTCIAGWVGLGPDPDRRTAGVAAMAAAMTPGGPPAHGTWTDGNALLAFPGPPGARPAALVEDGEVTAVIAFAGTLYGPEGVRRVLDARGHRPRSGGDPETVLHAYREWGADCPVRLDGAFAFALWDVRRRRLLLARDRLGVRPLHYARLGDELAFASEPKALLAGEAVDPAADADSLRELFTQIKTPGRSVFRGVDEVRPGHVVELADGWLTERAYWRLQSRPHPDDRDTTVATVRLLLSDAVNRMLPEEPTPCVLLSGGLDSGAVAALAARTSAERGAKPLLTATGTFLGHAENFRPDHVRATADAPYAAELARHLGSEHVDVVLGTADLADPAGRLAVLRAQDRPTPFAEMDVAAHLLFAAVRERAGVVLSGEAADELFGGFPWMHDPELVRTGHFPWVAYERSHEQSRDGLGLGLFDRGLLRGLDLAGFGADSYRQAIGEVPRLDGENAAERRMRELCHLHLTRWLPRLLDRDDRLSRAVGLDARMPFCDHRLVEYAFNVPWRMKSFDGREKSLLRAAVAPLLPRSVAQRRKSPFPVNQDPAYARMLQRELAAVLRDPAAPVAPLLDGAAARAAAGAEWPGGSDWLARTNIEFALQLNTWLAEYRVQLAV
ncbi:asparagine synthase (glutamine-hydrolyzing) [Kitasatospora sp. NPDC057904]|uniref:asparagine synthase (glutamine-hydrolyzing) n=1 Tax=Kitasatospora sp. NPDC057904 TaxID=3346275 RepID=UPI0036DD0E8F